MQRTINRVFIIALIGFLAGCLIFGPKIPPPVPGAFQSAESTGSLIGMVVFLAMLILFALKFPSARQRFFGGYGGIIIGCAIGLVLFGKLGALIATSF